MSPDGDENSYIFVQKNIINNMKKIFNKDNFTRGFKEYGGITRTVSYVDDQSSSTLINKISISD